MPQQPTTDPTGPDRPDPTAGSGRLEAADWSRLDRRRQALARTTDRALDLVADHLAESAPGRPRRSRSRRHAHTSAAEVAAAPTTSSSEGGRLRYIPPVAALGTAWVLQVIAVTDTLGTALARSLATSPVGWAADHPSVGYLAALALGVAVACCAEGGAAYLMDLYDKHLLARDSVGVLRLGMLAYVAGSAVGIHWWTEQRGLPSVLSWLLAGMSGSALFLWSRGSRWRNRVAMREAGQLDPALPKLPLAAKLLHPVRWLTMLYLISWEPVGTTDEARERYRSWKHQPTTRPNRAPAAEPTTDRAVPTPVPTDVWTAARPTADHRPLPVVPLHPPAAPTTDRTADRAPNRRPATKPSGRTTNKGPVRLVHGPTAVADAAFLRDRYGDDQTAEKFPGRNELYRLHGGNLGKWSAALRAHRDQADRAGHASGPRSEQADDAKEDSTDARELAAAGA
jgi:hypothetical protein